MDDERSEQRDGSPTSPSVAAELWRDYLNTEPARFASDFAATVTYIRDGHLAACAPAPAQLDMPPGDS